MSKEERRTWYRIALARDGKPPQIVAASGEWEDYLTISVEHAMAAGELPLLDDARQLTFEMVSFLEAANTRSLLHVSDEPYHRAEVALRARLSSLGADPALVSSIGAAAPPSRSPAAAAKAAQSA